VSGGGRAHGGSLRGRAASGQIRALCFVWLLELICPDEFRGRARLVEWAHLCNQAVAAAPHPFDVAWRVRVIPKSATQQLHALNDRFGGDHKPRPYALVQLVEADEVGRGAHERDEQIERQGLQSDDRSRTPHPPRCKVDTQIIDLVSRGIGVRSRVLVLPASNAMVPLCAGSLRPQLG